MRWELADKAMHSDIMHAVEHFSGQNVSDCYQCGKCSGGCPVVPDTTVSPNRVIRMVQLGLEQEALSNDLIWGCAACGTCTNRCPENVDIARVIDTLRFLAENTQAPFPPGGMAVRTFYRAFLDSVRDFGRLSEVGLMGSYNINSGRYMTNMLKAPWFLLKNKISLKAHKIRQIDRLDRVFKRIEEIEQAEIQALGEGK